MSSIISERLGHCIEAKAHLDLPDSPNVPGYELRHANGSSVQIANFGATVVRYHHPCPTVPDNVLFVSSLCVTDFTKPIRGGIPLVFPIFNAGDDPMGEGHEYQWTKELPSHGFARREHWNLIDTEAGAISISETECSLTLTLVSTPETIQKYPFPFVLRYTVTLRADACHTSLDITNTSDSATMPSQVLLHTYFNLPVHVTDVSIRGLHRQVFRDQTADDDDRMLTQESENLTLDQETDRVYVKAPDVLELRSDLYRVEIQKDARLTNHKRALPSDAVIWNPWIDKAKRMGDFGNEEYQHMLCIEPGLVHQYVHIPPQETLTLSQTIRIIS